MPPLDLDKLVSALASGSSDRKITCETLADEDEPYRNPDSPPESFWLSGDAESDWWDRNSVVYERKESTKGNSIIINSNPNSTSNSQRFSKSLKSKAAIIGLPKPQKTGFPDVKSRRHNRIGTGRLFLSRSGSIGKSDSTVVIEPLSPKVSCMGRVRSNRNRRLRARQRSISSTTAGTSATTVVRQKSSRSGRRKTGFFESIRAIFRSGRRGKPVQKHEEPTTKKSKGRKAKGSSITSSKASLNDVSFNESVQSEPVGLGAMNRFASGRRSESWL
ncbi:unnamed protein product [Lupinus luteus]|uniref:Uncharacterized protein n=1 Tax=Lupinus luteus TaxID=3873 RepID=A0AAV1VQW7_LUPLU